MKILFTDLDGTLLNNQSLVSEKSKSFLDAFIHAGNRLVLSSGRPLDSIIEVKEQAGLNYPGTLIIADNGALIYDCDRQTSILEKRMPLSYVSYLQTQAKALGLHIQTYTDDAVINTSEDEEIIFYRRKVRLPLLLVEDYASYLTKGPFKMLAIDLHNRNKLDAFCNAISDWAADKIQFIFSNDFYLELFVQDAGKGNALRYVCDYLQTPIENAYAAGDAPNDISMIKAAGCGIAMLNAGLKVKESADIITEYDNDNDGLAIFMQSVLN